MISTAVPVSHNGMVVYGGATPTTPNCFLGIIGDSGCLIDKSKWKEWTGVQGAGQVVDDTGQSIIYYSKANKDFAISTDKIVMLLPFIALILAFGLSIGWSKGHRYIA